MSKRFSLHIKTSQFYLYYDVVVNFQSQNEKAMKKYFKENKRGNYFRFMQEMEKVKEFKWKTNGMVWEFRMKL